MHGRSRDKDQLCSSTLVRSFFFLLLHSFFFTLFFTLLLCYCLHLRHEQGNRVSQAQVLRAKLSFLDSSRQFPKQFENVANQQNYLKISVSLQFFPYSLSNFEFKKKKNQYITEIVLLDIGAAAHSGLVPLVPKTPFLLKIQNLGCLQRQVELGNENQNYPYPPNNDWSKQAKSQKKGVTSSTMAVCNWLKLIQQVV